MALNEIDEIKELFQKELGNYQVKVDPNLWNGIQAGLGGAGAAAGAGTSLSLLAKISIGIGVAAAVVGTVLIVNNQQKESGEKHEIVKTTPIQEVTEEKADVEDSIETLELKNEAVIDEDKEAVIEEWRAGEPLSLSIEEQSVETPSVDDTPRHNPTEETHKNPEKNNVIINTPIEGNTPSSQKNALSKDEENTATPNLADLSMVTAQVVERDNQYIKFSAQSIPPGATVVWDFDDGRYDYDENPIHFFEESGLYNVTLTVKQEDNSVTREIPISIQIKGSLGDLPNVFTPNGDGRNDELFIESKHLKTFQLTVMDRSQNVVYTTNDPNFKWDGIDQKGSPVSVGEYIYIIVAEDKAGNMINKYQQLTIRR